MNPDPTEHASTLLFLRDWIPLLVVLAWIVGKGATAVLNLPKGGTGANAAANAKNVGAEVNLAGLGSSSGASEGCSREVERILGNLLEVARETAQATRQGISIDARVATLLELLERRIGAIESGQVRTAETVLALREVVQAQGAHRNGAPTHPAGG